MDIYKALSVIEAIIIVALAGLSFYSLHKITVLQLGLDEIKSKQYELYNIISNITNKVKDLKVELKELSSDLFKLSDDLEKLNKKVKQVETIEKDIDMLKEKIENISQTIDEIYAISGYIGNWITISETASTLELLSRLSEIERCSRGEAFDLACFSFYLYYKEGLTYAFDNETYGKEDVLISPSLFFETKKGDCEDFAYLYYNIIDFIRGNYNYLIVPKYEKYSTYTVYRETDIEWYFENTGEEYINIIKNKPYVFCFNNIVEGNRTEGHCIVALCPYNITQLLKMSDFSLFTECTLIEPQDFGWKYEVKIAEFPYFELIETPEYKRKVYDIYLIIGEGKICLETERWLCLPFQE